MPLEAAAHAELERHWPVDFDTSTSQISALRGHVFILTEMIRTNSGAGSARGDVRPGCNAGRRGRHAEVRSVRFAGCCSPISDTIFGRHNSNRGPPAAKSGAGRTARVSTPSHR